MLMDLSHHYNSIYALPKIESSRGLGEDQAYLNSVSSPSIPRVGLQAL